MMLMKLFKQEPCKVEGQLLVCDLRYFCSDFEFADFFLKREAKCTVMYLPYH